MTGKTRGTRKTRKASKNTVSTSKEKYLVYALAIFIAWNYMPSSSWVFGFVVGAITIVPILLITLLSSTVNYFGELDVGKYIPTIASAVLTQRLQEYLNIHIISRVEVSPYSSPEVFSQDTPPKESDHSQVDEEKKSSVISSEDDTPLPNEEEETPETKKVDGNCPENKDNIGEPSIEKNNPLPCESENCKEKEHDDILSSHDRDIQKFFEKNPVLFNYLIRKVL